MNFYKSRWLLIGSEPRELKLRRKACVRIMFWPEKSDLVWSGLGEGTSGSGWVMAERCGHTAPPHCPGLATNPWATALRGVSQLKDSPRKEIPLISSSKNLHSNHGWLSPSCLQGLTMAWCDYPKFSVPLPLSLFPFPIPFLFLFSIIIKKLMCL